MSEADRILELMFDRPEEFITPHELAASAGLNRAEADKALGVIQARGQELEFSPGGGVRLARPVRLDAYLIERRLQTRRIGRNVICFEEVDSTNDVALDSLRRTGAECGKADEAAGGPDGLVVLAEFQRRGRGRFGRAWLSPPRSNILMSVLLTDPLCKLAHEALTIAAGVAIAEGIESACGIEARLRWPNDVLVDGKKAAGILVELHSIEGLRALVVGIGINANWAPESGVDAPAIDLADQTGHPVERIEVVRAVLRRLDCWVERIEAGRLEELHSAWTGRCGMLNERITVVSAGERYVGRALDVNPLEGLILGCDDGRCLHLPAESSTLIVSR